MNAAMDVNRLWAFVDDVYKAGLDKRHPHMMVALLDMVLGEAPDVAFGVRKSKSKERKAKIKERNFLVCLRFLKVYDTLKRERAEPSYVRLKGQKKPIDHAAELVGGEFCLSAETVLTIYREKRLRESARSLLRNNCRVFTGEEYRELLRARESQSSGERNTVVADLLQSFLHGLDVAR